MSMLKGRDMGIDLGTSSTLVHLAGKGIVLTEPSLVAIERSSGKVLAVGQEAAKLLGRAPGGVTVIRPLRDGVVNHFHATTCMLRYFIEKTMGKPLVKPRAVVCMPSGVTDAEKHCISQAALEAGVGRVYLIEEPLAAAIGTGMDIFSQEGRMVLDIGGGTTDIAIISNGCILLSCSVRMAGDRLNEAVERFLGAKHKLSVGERGAEDIKIAYGGAYLENEQRIIEIRGRSLITGLPEILPMGTNELVDALNEPLSHILSAMEDLMSRTPPALMEGIRKEGVTATGGGALLRGLSDYVTAQLGIPCRVAEDPITCVARGIGLVLEDVKKYGCVLAQYDPSHFFEE